MQHLNCICFPYHVQNVNVVCVLLFPLPFPLRFEFNSIRFSLSPISENTYENCKIVIFQWYCSFKYHTFNCFDLMMLCIKFYWYYRSIWANDAVCLCVWKSCQSNCYILQIIWCFISIENVVRIWLRKAFPYNWIVIVYFVTTIYLTWHPGTPSMVSIEMFVSRFFFFSQQFGSPVVLHFKLALEKIPLKSELFFFWEKRDVKLHDIGP